MSNDIHSESIQRDEHARPSGVPGKRVYPYGWDGSNPQPLKTDSSGRLSLDPASVGGGSSFAVNDIEEGTTSYFGFTTDDGTWQVKKLTDTLVSYATVTNNGSVTTYSDAWTNRVTLTYGRYDQAF